MLEKLLHLIADRGLASPLELAPMLAVNPALIQSMLEELTRQGYLKQMVPACLAPCDSCTICLFPDQPRIWALSAKGERFLTRKLPHCREDME
jgi:hypothetical protein